MTDRPTKGNLIQAIECLEAGGEVISPSGCAIILRSDGRLVWCRGGNVVATKERLTEPVFRLKWPKVKKWKWAVTFNDGQRRTAITGGHYATVEEALEEAKRWGWGTSLVLQRIDATMIEEPQ